MDEYISREAVLKAFRITAKNSNKDYQRGLQDAIDCLVPEVIADIPAADVQPVDIISADTRSEIIGYFYEFNVRADIKIEDLVDDVITIITNNLNNGK